MGTIGLVISLLAAGAMIIGLIPFLGWLNWFTTLPLAAVGLLINIIALIRFRKLLAIIGIVICLVAFVIGAARLFIGCGIF